MEWLFETFLLANIELSYLNQWQIWKSSKERTISVCEQKKSMYFIIYYFFILFDHIINI